MINFKQNSFYFWVFLVFSAVTPHLYAAPSEDTSSKTSKKGQKANSGQPLIITLWSRKTGPHHDTPNPVKVNEKTLTIPSNTFSRKKLFDAQYGRTSTYLGVRLKKILSSYKPQPHDDGFVLHFANKMAILLELGSPTLNKINGFIATQTCPTKGTCSDGFPSINKEEIDSPYQDPRPITFGSNKFISATLSHPDLGAPLKPVFSPWKYVDSLVGVEFVNIAAYKKQFSVGEEEAGEKVFWQRCQFCHGVRLVGSRMGWDLVTPLPIFEKRAPEVLLNHIKYPKTRAKEMGLMMPNQPDMTIAEAETLWRWLKVIAQKPTPEYKP